MRYFLAIFTVIVIAVVSMLGCRGTHSRKTPISIFPDMDFQTKLRPQKDFGFFPDGGSSQLPVPGTVARSVPLQTVGGPVWPHETAPVNTGLVTGTTNFVEHNPLPITAELLKRGQQRYTINCTPCHGALGDANGITRKIGAMAVVGNLHDKRMVQMGDGELFYVITHGRNLMGAYAGSVTIQDRWAVVAYVRALQLARLGTVEDLPEGLRASLKK